MKMLIDGRWQDTEETIPVTDPWDGTTVDTVPKGTPDHVDQAIAAATRAFRTWRFAPVMQRMEILRKVAEHVSAHLEDYARLIAREGSKTIREARKEVRRCVNTLTLSAEEARRLYGQTIPFDSFPGGEHRHGYWFREPIGVIAAITPFNDPLNLVAHKLGPAIAGGNTVVLKPATVTPLSALKLAEAFEQAGLPPGVLNVVTGPGNEIGNALVTDQRVRMVSFTGGVEAGLAITRIAGLKKIGMELGSNSPVIVMADCDFDRAVADTVSGAFWAAGQNCIGVQRVFVQRPIFDRYLEAFVARTKAYKVGPKLEEDCDMGPVITEAEARRIEGWIAEAAAAGATVQWGGRRGGPVGTVVEPTVLTGVTPQMKVARQEVFGPVVALWPFDELEEAVQLANSVDYGLHAAIFTKSLAAAHFAIKHLECGGVIVNDSTDYRLDQMPFGGIKNSGLGREGVAFALLEMTEPKVVCFTE
ncbi:MAG: aldehyde dehydrogenase family protein [Thermoanaerobaculaceae bacterium]